MFEVQFKEIPNKSLTNSEKSIIHVIQLKMAQHAMNGWDGAHSGREISQQEGMQKPQEDVIDQAGLETCHTGSACSRSQRKQGLEVEKRLQKNS